MVMLKWIYYYLACLKTDLFINLLILKMTFVPSYLGILAIGLINEALDEGDAQKTLQALQIPAAKLEGVLAEVAQHYQDTLIRAKREKAQVSAIEIVFCAENFSFLEPR